MAESQVRSYNIRASRMTTAQRRAYRDFGPLHLLPFRLDPLDWEEVFPGKKCRIVEIGFGMGDATHSVAADNPQTAYLGIDVHQPGVGRLLWWIEREGLKNLKIIEHDAFEVFGGMLPPLSVDGIHIWFPDPWPKKRHHKRRLIQPPFVDMMERTLREGAYIHVVTDWESYAGQIRQLFRDHSEFEEAPSFLPRPQRPETKFEKRAGKSCVKEIYVIKKRKVSQKHGQNEFS